MDILNIISWIKERRVINSVPNNALIPVALKDDRRDDKYLTCLTTKEDLLKHTLETTLFAFPFNYVVTPVMEEISESIEGPSFFFGNTIKLKGYRVSGKIAVGTNYNFWYIGTISANQPLFGDLPFKVTGVVDAFDDSGTGFWVQTGLSDAARFSDTAGGTVNAEYCTIVEDYNSTPGSIELYLAVGSSAASGDIYGNVAFQYEMYFDEALNITFTI